MATIFICRLLCFFNFVRGQTFLDILGSVKKRIPMGFLKCTFFYSFQFLNSKKKSESVFLTKNGHINLYFYKQIFVIFCFSDFSALFSSYLKTLYNCVFYTIHFMYLPAFCLAITFLPKFSEATGFIDSTLC